MINTFNQIPFIKDFDIPILFWIDNQGWGFNQLGGNLFEDKGVTKTEVYSNLEEMDPLEFNIVNLDSGFICQRIFKNSTAVIFQIKAKKGVFSNQKFQDLDLDMQAIFENAFDVIYVSNSEGDTVRVSSASKEIWGYTPNDLIGENVYELEKQGVFRPSVTRLVIEKGEKVSAIQTTTTGRRLIILGIPVKDTNGKLIRVVNVSRDITELNNLQKELHVTKNLLEGYKEELLTLRQKSGINQKIICRSSQVKNALVLAQRAALSDSSILITGEPGVGKTTLGNFIHENGNRCVGPFITINCAAMFGDVIDEEIFGQHDNVTGESVIQKANNGTLFLENISELDLSAQAKLIHFLQNSREYNVRIIATSEKDLYEYVERGEFRKDLYYNLNVFSIHLPPLQERKKDIIPLAMFFLKQLNEVYKQNKHLGKSLEQSFYRHDWPGNVRELKNIMERLVVFSDKEIIDSTLLPDYFIDSQTSSQPINVREIIPLKEAVEIVEKTLLLMAMEQTNSTTDAAKVLKINQSNISRKLNKYSL